MRLMPCNADLCIRFHSTGQRGGDAVHGFLCSGVSSPSIGCSSGEFICVYPSTKRCSLPPLGLAGWLGYAEWRGEAWGQSLDDQPTRAIKNGREPCRLFSVEVHPGSLVLSGPQLLTSVILIIFIGKTNEVDGSCRKRVMLTRDSFYPLWQRWMEMKDGKKEFYIITMPSLVQLHGRRKLVGYLRVIMQFHCYFT